MTINCFIGELVLYLCNSFVTSIPSHHLRLAYYRSIMRFELARGVAIHMGCRFDSWRGLRVGEYSVINARSRLDTRGGIQIGSNVSISESVIILTADHDLCSVEFPGIKRGVVIGDYVFIGTGALVLPGCRLGCGAALGAGSVLTKSIPDYEIWAGCPARPIGKRPSGLSYQLSYRRLFH